jgi:hypothetical protein
MRIRLVVVVLGALVETSMCLTSPNITCRTEYTVAWTQHPSFISPHKNGTIGGALYHLLLGAIRFCRVDNVTLELSTPKDFYSQVETELDDEDFALPVSRQPTILYADQHIDTWVYVPIAESRRKLI